MECEKWENGYTITSAPIYYDGMIYIGMSGGEFGVRGRLTALDAKSGQILVLWYFPECKIAIISTSYAYMSMS